MNEIEVIALLQQSIPTFREQPIKFVSDRRGQE
jgi:hypothetical protein